MADWIGNARSSYCKVKDLKSFKVFCQRWDITMIEKDNFYGFICEGEFSGLPNFLEDEINGKIVEFGFDDFIKELSQHIADGWAIILQEVGAERLRYITGASIAVSNRGIEKEIYLSDIYRQIELNNFKTTSCDY
jgi:hypothetical protein